MNDGRTEPEREALPLEDVGRLVELLAESGIGEIRVRQGELEITVKARSEAAAGTPSAPQTEPQATPRIEVTPVPEAEPSVVYRRGHEADERDTRGRFGRGGRDPGRERERRRV